MNHRKTAAAAVVLGLATVMVGGLQGAAPAEQPSTSPGFSATKTITRVHREAGGRDTVAESRTFTVTVDQNIKLRGNQLIGVSWSGAHPTLGKVPNPNSRAARFTEYPVMLIECRGDGSAGAPVDPRNCFTQTIDEREHDSGDLYPPWRVDRFASPAERAQLVGYPDPRPEGCPPPVRPTARYIPFVAADGTVYNPIAGLKTRVCGQITAPEMVTVEEPAAPPGNTTYATTDVNGNGSAKFAVLTGAENASLGCSATVKCSLVIIPIMGISCDVTGSGVPPELAEDVDTNCRATGRNAPGQLPPLPGEFGVDAAVTAEFWWSASNWNNKVVVPLGFGTPSNVCEVGDNRVPLDVFGSELMTQATTQWTPAVCLNQQTFPFRFRHVKTGEPQAKSALASGSATMALVSTPPPEGYAKPTVNAPVGITGFAVSYLIDDKNKIEYTKLRLNPRLIAKALTESYLALRPGSVFAGLPNGNPYKVLQHNPLDLSTDPEFIALNPNVGDHHSASQPTSSTVLTLSGTSDVTTALTSYLNNDPEARAWLNGTPDPWGMVVNPGYRNIPLPQPFWPLLDTFTTEDGPPVQGPCQHDDIKKLPNVPLGPLVAAPVSTLAITGQQVQYANSVSRTICQVVADTNNDPVGVQLVAAGRQAPGNRFMLAVASIADAQFLELNTAALQSTSSINDPNAKFTDASGRTFVAPTAASVQTAMRLAKPNQQTGTWPIPYDTFRSAQGATAYPGTMAVYAAVPTSGLTPDDATHAAQLLRFMVGDGQKPGLDNGQLPPGYVPVTGEFGFGDLAVYTLKAADAVAAQTGQVPLVTGAAPQTGGSSGVVQAPDNGFRLAPFNPNNGAGQQVPQAAAAPPNTVVPAPSSTPNPVNAVSAGKTPGLSSAFARWALPIALIVAAAAALTGVGSRCGYVLFDKIRSRR